MSDTKTWTEYGYRLPDGREAWEIDHGTDGSWIPYTRLDTAGSEHIEAIDIYDGKTLDHFREQLAGRATALTRTVTTIYGPVEVHDA